MRKTEIVIAILAVIFLLTLSFFIAVLAASTALRAFSKTLVDLVEEVEKTDKDSIFWDAWRKHFK